MTVATVTNIRYDCFIYLTNLHLESRFRRLSPWSQCIDGPGDLDWSGFCLFSSSLFGVSVPEKVSRFTLSIGLFFTLIIKWQVRNPMVAETAEITIVSLETIASFSEMTCIYALFQTTKIVFCWLKNHSIVALKYNGTMSIVLLHWSPEMVVTTARNRSSQHSCYLAQMPSDRVTHDNCKFAIKHGRKHFEHEL